MLREIGLFGIEVVMFPISVPVALIEGVQGRLDRSKADNYVRRLAENTRDFGDTTFADRLGLFLLPLSTRRDARQKISQALEEYRRYIGERN